MEPTTPRRYRSELRARQAGETRLRIVEAAAELFTELGYAGTTLTRIATRAGVSPETVQAHGPKAALLRAGAELRGLGAESLDHFTQTPSGRAIVEASRDDVPAAAAAFIAPLHRSIAGLWEALLAGANGDPEVREYLLAIVEHIRRQHGDLYDLFLSRGWARTDRPRDEIVDTWAQAASPEGYIRLVHHFGWSDERYAAYLATALEHLMLAPARG